MQTQETLFSARTLSIIVPVFNERKSLNELLDHLDSIGAEQLIIVDGGSVDGSLEYLQRQWQDGTSEKIVLSSTPGRAKQMNLGASQATSDILLFLHADTRLAKGAKKAVLAAREEQALWGFFDVAFKGEYGRTLAMRTIALFINMRSRLSSIATGDQGIFVDNAIFRKLGGYEGLPLMEDVALSKSLKRVCVPHCSRLALSTSARRWQTQGVVKTVLLMWYLRLAYFLGISPQTLAKQYRHIR